jgi:hypothetical protein
MKKWSVIMAIVMTLLVVALSPMAALAQTDEDAAVASSPGLRDGLAIVAPLATPVDTEISISVYRRQGGDIEARNGCG